MGAGEVLLHQALMLMVVPISQVIEHHPASLEITAVLVLAALVELNRLPLGRPWGAEVGQ